MADDQSQFPWKSKNVFFLLFFCSFSSSFRPLLLGIRFTWLYLNISRKNADFLVVVAASLTGLLFHSFVWALLHSYNVYKQTRVRKNQKNIFLYIYFKVKLIKFCMTTFFYFYFVVHINGLKHCIRC